VAKLKSLGELEALRKSIVDKRDPDKPVIAICNGTGCHAHGCKSVTEAFRETVTKQKMDGKVEIRETGCHGFCERGPLVVIKPKDIFYQRVRVKDVAEILTETIGNGKTVDRLLYTDRKSGKKLTYEREVPFYKLQKRLVFGNNGSIDPSSIEDYIAVGGYAALKKVLTEMSPEQVIEEVKKSVTVRIRFAWVGPELGLFNVRKPVVVGVRTARIGVLAVFNNVGQAVSVRIGQGIAGT